LFVNGIGTPIDPQNPNVAPIIVPPGRTMLPLRFIAESLGCQVDWNQALQEVTVTYPKP
jgi:titin